MWSMRFVKKSEIQSNNENTTKWNRKLIFRSHLTMYTSYTRKDNTEPASVTALTISKYVLKFLLSFKVLYLSIKFLICFEN